MCVRNHAYFSSIYSLVVIVQEYAGSNLPILEIREMGLAYLTYICFLSKRQHLGLFGIYLSANYFTKCATEAGHTPQSEITLGVSPTL